MQQKIHPSQDISLAQNKKAYINQNNYYNKATRDIDIEPSLNQDKKFQKTNTNSTGSTDDSGGETYDIEKNDFEKQKQKDENHQENAQFVTQNAPYYLLPLKNFTRFPQYENYYEFMKNQNLSRIQTKCSHNSYDIENYYEQLTFDNKKPYQGGVLMLEFDIYPKININSTIQQKYKMGLAHTKDDKEEKPLINALQEVNEYLQDNPQSLPIFITLNIKEWLLDLIESPKVFFDSIEFEFLEIFSQNQIFTPKQILQGEKNLYDAIIKFGQPKVSQMLGKIVIIIDPAQSNLKNQKEFQEIIDYYTNDLSDKLMFATLDSDLIQNGDYINIKDFMETNNKYNQIFVNLKGDYTFQDKKEKYFKTFDILNEAKELNFISRLYNLNQIDQYILFRDMGMNFLCTDHIFDYPPYVAY
ncbi:PLC-like phosphodiesterase, TIM beta/alpha-barrel domain [Pseudocohnilembus persalinus]|uniref:PLC-like phosphodiesterase, TIM beta/alpha-barrel domain n=1 Tax=Pseudocohnilembus persalinus TaxID=266149 RepID=A0A0V0QWE3_PSEPJ|nr:PLC-like phosphodiesterase, TIM beta/alpha-barrel domain [Pseudocohnilembus persalinus]|eukprot:KRX06336.1 PLC-like phosphodiesterase, TIM beta/alpha-barrel domain [Pseudocohnilembus persalinus]